MRIRILFVLAVAAAAIMAPSIYPADYESFLSEHRAIWGPALQEPERVLTDSLLSNQMFLIGEVHGIAATYDIQYDLIAYLQKHAGIRYLVVELAGLDGTLINRFLETGDTTCLDMFFAPYRATFSWSKDLATFLKKLRALNLSLPVEQRLVVLPLDLEFGHRRAISWLCDSLFGPADSAGILLRTLQPQTDSAGRIIRVFTAAWDHLAAHDSLYRESLGSRYPETAYLMRNVRARYLLQDPRLFNQQRDSVMLENFNYWREFYNITNEKMVGLFGNYHVVQVQDSANPRIGAILRSISDASGNAHQPDGSLIGSREDGAGFLPKGTRPISGIVSFYTAYSECMQMFPSAQADDTALSAKYHQLVRYYWTGLGGDSLGCMDLLKELNGTHRASIFVVQPTGGSDRLSDNLEEVDSSAVSMFLPRSVAARKPEDAYQAIIFIHGSPAAEPYGPNEK